MRYLFASESGELYMLAFCLDFLHLIQGLANPNFQEGNQFMIVEFLGHKLSPCSTMQYLDNGFVFYGS